jgi:hypothetical protein
MMDPTLPPRPGRRRTARQPWFAVLDAGVRQCQAMEREANEECPLLHSLLNAVSTMAVTREAKAQETFNLVAVVGGVLFGVSALILALYDASAILPRGGPVSSTRRRRWQSTSGCAGSVTRCIGSRV